MREDLYELPKGWVWTSIKEIGEVITGTTPSKSNPEYYGRDFPFFKPTDLNKGYYVRKAEDGLSKEGIQKARLIPEKSILVTCIGATISKTGFIRVQGSCNQQINAIVPKINILPEFIYFWCISPIFKKNIIDNASSTTLPILNKSKFETLSILLPPIPEQHRIVAKIEELFTQLDAGVELLKKVKAKLKRYRQTVLKAAVEGNLTKQWREANQGELEPASILLERILKQRREKWEAEQLGKMKAQGKTPKDDSWKLKYKEAIAPDTSDLPELPDGWCWVSIDQISHLVTDGDHNPPKRSERVPFGIPHLTAKNINNWKLSEEGCSYITQEDFQRIRKRYEPKAGDVVITCVGTLGRTAIVPDNYLFSADRNLAIVRLVDNVMLEKFLLVNLNTVAAQKNIHNASGSTAQPHFYLADIRAFRIVLAPIDEQSKIIEETDYLLSVTDQLEKTINANLKRAERLRQTILKQAFEGKLVPQDPNDEPAEKLLERIKAEKVQREEEKKSKRTTKPKSSKPHKAKTEKQPEAENKPKHQPKIETTQPHQKETTGIQLELFNDS